MSMKNNCLQKLWRSRWVHSPPLKVVPVRAAAALSSDGKRVVGVFSKSPAAHSRMMPRHWNILGRPYICPRKKRKRSRPCFAKVRAAMCFFAVRVAVDGSSTRCSL